MRPNCKVPNCERLAYGPRGMCWKHYNRARADLRRWREGMELRRWLAGRGLVAEVAPGGAVVVPVAAGGKQATHG